MRGQDAEGEFQLREVGDQEDRGCGAVGVAGGVDGGGLEGESGEGGQAGGGVVVGG